MVWELFRASHLPTSVLLWLGCSLETDDEVGEAGEASPEDDGSGRRVVFSGKVSAEAGDGDDVEVEVWPDRGSGAMRSCLEGP